MALQLAVRPAFAVLFDFRDVILRKSALGQEVLSLYRAHAREAIEVVISHPSLLHKTMAVFTRGIILAQDMLRAHSLSANDVAAGALRLDQDAVNEIAAVLRDFKERAPRGELAIVLARIEEILESMAGKNGRKILSRLTVENPSTL